MVGNASVNIGWSQEKRSRNTWMSQEFGKWIITHLITIYQIPGTSKQVAVYLETDLFWMEDLVSIFSPFSKLPVKHMAEKGARVRDKEPKCINAHKEHVIKEHIYIYIYYQYIYII